jgi:uncharacterized BrkB/YihY/UPF0761 family membrane protein
MLPQAVLTAVGLALLGVGSAYYMPDAMSSSGRQFGFIGVAFVLLSWLFAAAAVLVVAAVIGAEATKSMAGEKSGEHSQP